MRARIAGLAAGAALAAAGVWAAPEPAHAQSLRELLGRGAAPGRGQAAATVGRYTAAQGDGFIFDRTDGRAYLKFDAEAEVWALTAHPGPRGDLIYRNDIGQPMVRATRLGGLILFTPERPAGTPAAYAGPASTLRPRPMTPNQLLRHLAQTSVRASRALRRTTPFEAPDVTSGAEPLIADAASLAAQAVVQSASAPRGRSALARLRRVRFLEGRAAGVALNGDALVVTIAPARGVAGRPSSRKIALALQMASP